MEAFHVLYARPSHSDAAHAGSSRCFRTRNRRSASHPARRPDVATAAARFQRHAASCAGRDRDRTDGRARGHGAPRRESQLQQLPRTAKDRCAARHRAGVLLLPYQTRGEEGAFRAFEDQTSPLQIRGDLAFRPAHELGALIRERHVTSTDLTKMYLARLKRYAPQLLCVITLTEDLALTQADKADTEIRHGHHRGPLHGVPYGDNDLFATKGIRSEERRVGKE